ncbi:MAG TPA: hypothetical protein G4N97_01885 [Thermoflexia bacterium]|nr:hypothetical protein [Thermoflexia bacterium]
MNIIFIVIDSLRQDHISSYVGDRSPVQTPNIDRLAAQSAGIGSVGGC